MSVQLDHAVLHPQYKTPVVSLVVQGIWTCLLCLSGTYGQLLDYIIFAVLVFYVLTVAGLFVTSTQVLCNRFVFDCSL